MTTLERRTLMEPDEILRKQNLFYDVFEVEDFYYSEPEFSRTVGTAPPAPIAAATQTTDFQIRNLSPDKIKKAMLVDYSGISREPLRMYQVLMGINIDNVFAYLEVMAGVQRLGVAQVPKPNAANRRVAKFDYRTSPPEDPKVEFWTETGQVPSAYLFNNNGFATAEVLLECVGRKFTLLLMTEESHPVFFERYNAGQPVTYRRITEFGLDSEFVSSTKIANV